MSVVSWLLAEIKRNEEMTNGEMSEWRRAGKALFNCSWKKPYQKGTGALFQPCRLLSLREGRAGLMQGVGAASEPCQFGPAWFRSVLCSVLVVTCCHSSHPAQTHNTRTNKSTDK